MYLAAIQIFKAQTFQEAAQTLENRVSTRRCQAKSTLQNKTVSEKKYRTECRRELQIIGLRVTKRDGTLQIVEQRLGIVKLI